MRGTERKRPLEPAALRKTRFVPVAKDHTDACVQEAKMPLRGDI